MSYIKEELKSINERVEERYHQYGYSSETLDSKDFKLMERYKILTSQYDFRTKKILDIGCGFGGINQQLLSLVGNEYTYMGIDISKSVIEEAEKHYKEENVKFVNGEFLDYVFEEKFDYGVLSGALNYPVGDDNYEYVYQVMKKSLSLCEDGIAFDFLSDRVDYRYEHAFYYNPMKILEIAYQFSRRILLRNDYFPFEYSVFVWNDDSFLKEDTTFIQYKRDYKK